MTNNTATCTGLDSINDVTVATALTGSDLLVLAAHVKASTEATIATTRAGLADNADAASAALVERVLGQLADSADAMLVKLHAAYEAGLDALWLARRADGRWSTQVRPRTVAPLAVVR